MVDKDLLSIQEARALVHSARSAQNEFALLSQERVDSIIKAIAEAATKIANELAQLAVEETGFGKVEDKTTKNLLASEKLYDAIKDMKTIGVINNDISKKIIEIAVPTGVIAGIVPSTNPTSTTIYKSLISLKSGNAIVFTPHPSASQCIGKTVELIRDTLRSCGVSEDMVSVMTIPTIEGSGELMRKVDLILATGGPGMVKAAYSSGTPALGVGAGNVPVYIERTADIHDAVTKIMASKTFDNGTICASEQAIITDKVIDAQVKATLKAQGGYFLQSAELECVKRVMERPNGSMNPAIVGRDAKYIADLAGITVPSDTRLLIGEESGVGPAYPFSKEKLTALIGYYTVEDWNEACELSIKLLHNGGVGHSLAIHSKDESVICAFGLKKPVSRMLVNTPSTHGAVGLSTNLFPSFTLGCGAVGGSSTSDNVTPEHLIDIRRVAYDTEELTYKAVQSYSPSAASPVAASQIMFDSTVSTINSVDTIPVEISARHVHLSEEDAVALFGGPLTKVRELSQPGQFLCKERIRLIGPKGVIDNVAVLGPSRNSSQVEISKADARILGIKTPLRQSGDTEGTPGVILASQNNIVGLEEGVIIAARHIHMHTKDAERFGVVDKDVVSVHLQGERALILEEVLVRVNDDFALSMHIDIDEGNSVCWNKDTTGRIVAKKASQLGVH
ncbi:acetaldehyde dehydrogenase (acetylating) [Vibrio sp. HN007]|uniref:acetaldehyde dehydrogenase (acetylating) n=1 Tax=Vibrio iocasae TaxID=3098914 RepID=UPI0035D511DD